MMSLWCHMNICIIIFQIIILYTILYFTKLQIQQIVRKNFFEEKCYLLLILAQKIFHPDDNWSIQSKRRQVIFRAQVSNR